MKAPLPLSLLDYLSSVYFCFWPKWRGDKEAQCHSWMFGGDLFLSERTSGGSIHEKHHSPQFPAWLNDSRSVLSQPVLQVRRGLFSFLLLDPRVRPEVTPLSAEEGSTDRKNSFWGTILKSREMLKSGKCLALGYTGDRFLQIIKLF